MVGIIFNIANTFNHLDYKRSCIMKFLRGLDFKNEPVLAIINLILYIFLIIVIYQIFLKIIGRSPIFETVIMGILGILIINSFRHEFLLGKFVGENKEFKKNIEQSFNHIKEDIKIIRKEIEKIRN